MRVRKVAMAARQGAQDWETFATTEPEFGGELECDRCGAHVPWRVRQGY